MTDEAANIIIAQFLFLANEDHKSDIHFYINSPGGSVSAGLGILDTMRFVEPGVCTYIIGQAASMGSVLACAGAKGKQPEKGAVGCSRPGPRWLSQHLQQQCGFIGQPNDTAVEPRATGPLADYETTSTAPSRDAAVHWRLGSPRPSSSKRPLGVQPCGRS